MAESAGLANTSGDGPEVKDNFSSKKINSLKEAPSKVPLNSSFNTGGALQQLTELLNIHARGGTLNQMKGSFMFVEICVYFASKLYLR